MKRYHIYVEGLVQGVGFRWFCMSVANKYHLTGTVKNLYNGMVEIYVQGSTEKIDMFIQELYKGNRFSKVDDMTMKACPIVENESDFTVLY